MIVAIEGLIPDRRSSSSPAQPTAPPVKPDIYETKWLRKQQNQASEEPAATEAQEKAPLPGAVEVENDPILSNFKRNPLPQPL